MYHRFQKIIPRRETNGAFGFYERNHRFNIRIEIFQQITRDDGRAALNPHRTMDDNWLFVFYKKVYFFQYLGGFQNLDEFWVVVFVVVKLEANHVGLFCARVLTVDFGATIDNQFEKIGPFIARPGVAQE
jgi:hypothetical protein